ncbi:MAG: N-acetylmuramoyl-L-alanine amidase family protein [Lachnospiraceae bacterium]|nr:N-acetylmuramoyl-L-alanine amidase family protein [Lachnospiraceae bacterium]
MSIHCYDMVEYNGEVFFAGMVRGSGDTVVNCVQKLNTSDLGSSKAASNIKFYYADGTEFKAEWDTYKLADGTTQTYFNSEYWRTYDMFVYKGELYVAHSSSTKYTVTPESGLFKYDKQNNRFVQVSKGTDTKGFMAVTRNMTSLGYVTGVSGRTELHYPFGQQTAKAGALTVGQEAIYSEPICGAKISTSDTFVAVCNGIFKSSDVITFEKVSLGAGYENYVTRDAFEKDGKYYFLASVKNGTNNFTTAVFETDKNFTTFRRVLYFNTPSFARSFVYNDGYIYIGLGGNGRIDNLGDSEGSPYSGTLYRINLEKLVSGTSDKTPDDGKTETPSTSEVTTEEKTETPSTSEVTTEEKTETPSTSEVTTEEKTETPSTSEVTTEEKTETPSTSEVTTEEKTETPSTSEVTTEEKTELPSTSEVTTEEKTETSSTSEETSKDEVDKEIKTGWVKVGAKWYYFNADGTMQTGWFKDNGKWYYLNADGSMKTGWFKDGGKWYYLSENGTMKTGWFKDSGTWYYLNANGSMQTGWLKDGGKWYYLSGSGAMAQGWMKVSGKWYYLGNSGGMITGWFKQSNVWYYLSDSGAMLNGWQKIKNKWYYFYASGKMASNTKIGSYYVNSNGEWVK